MSKAGRGFGWFLSIAASVGAQEAPRSFFQAVGAAQQAQAARDPAQAQRMLEAALGFAPESGGVLYYLARVQAEQGDEEAALATLGRLTQQGTKRDIRGDAAFAALKDDARFEAVVKRIEAAAAPLVASTVSHRIEDTAFLPEGLAYDAASNRFFAGSLSGGIVQWRASEKTRPFHRPDNSGGHVVLGLRVDPERHRLWAATLRLDAAAPKFFRGRGGYAALEAYDLDSGEPVARHEAPRDGDPHLFNDIAVLDDGDVYVTDSEGRALWRLRGGDLAKVAQSEGEFTYPNGIAVGARGELYIAHVEGLSRFDPAAEDAKLVRLPAPTGVSAGGIDGLYACGDGLLAVQNLSGFQQVTHFALADSGTRIAAARALERDHPRYDAPTTGAIAGDAFHYIANAQLRRLDDDMNLKPGEPANAPEILALPLQGACTPS